ncbi:hypothetical protein I33_0258 [Bacillus subtilis subsp. subtilis str. RO-NN-1]|uniref:Uncharacterized protein n=1 Tax=Bacillus subtilis TaxID=1423 RepID=A0A0D1KQ79_BACIU|nr:hypothetical protein I33_0258 [Bacillus subtilis subsp. subtilis str. RO-NN-1]AHA76177.1 Hypothetical Protein U712_01115 [Bacillus subtilis PY79]AKE22022.1 hypothetical protein BsLM_0223 [Bacillus sp. LM 4-2]AKN12291.1 hypothetical protein ABU16_1215 [Bacillus subtilis]EME05109.1 hypothetical protein BS732_4069 [Bacillus subtilis MB73/2]BAI83659.1 hypothetical protein BSNT_06521 [Bacillus subtilis subsp. natto BEST195]GAK79197.1 hypothetical protein BSMD_011010 [Bacillus subtilis Miyagi-4]
MFFQKLFDHFSFLINLQKTIDKLKKLHEHILTYVHAVLY